MDQRRTLGLVQTIREELAEIITFELEDPRLIGVDITSVHVSHDSRYADVKFGAGGEERKQNEALAALVHAGPYLRGELALRLQLRHMPELRFERDKNPDADTRIDFLLRRAKNLAAG